MVQNRAMAELLRYAAFISYSSEDAAFARRLHRALESFSIPTQLGRIDVLGGGDRKYLNRIAPVFKDREELPSGSLGELLEASLKASSSLVVVCSPSSARSEWVDKEIRFFENLGRKARIFAIIAKDAPDTSRTGELEAECFPPALRHAERVRAGETDAPDLICGDARSGKDGFRNAWLKVVAGIIGVNFGVLADRDRRRRRRNRIQIGAVAAALMLGAFCAAVWVDTLTWRTRFSTVAENIMSQGIPLAAATFALGGEPLGGALISARSDRADATLVRIASVSMGFDLGKLANTEIGGGFLLSANGAVLVAKNGDQTATYYDLVHRLSRPLGNFGRHPQFQLSADGKKLLAGMYGEDGKLNWALIDLAHDGRTRQLGQLAFNNGALLSESGTLLVTQKDDGNRAYYELSHDGVAHDLGRLLALDLADNGAAIVTADEDGSVTFYDLIQRTHRNLGRVGQGAHFFLSKNGAGLVILDAGTSGPLISEAVQAATATYYDLTNGAPGRPLGQLGGYFELSANGHALLVTQSDGTGIYYDLSRPGAVRNLGRIKYSAMSNDGTVVVTQDQNGVGAYYNFAHGDVPVPLGNIGRSFILSGDGTVLAIRDADGKGFSYNLVRRAKFDLGDIGVHNGGIGMGLHLSANGAALVTQSEYDHIGRYFDLVNKTPARELGRLDFVALSANGQALVTLNMDGSALYYALAAGAPPHFGGAALAADVCAMSGDAIRPFPPSLRDPARVTERRTAADQNLFTILRGRPWHPCDWRGLLAGREGFAQLWRLIKIRYFGAPDYVCEERTASGRRDAVSIARCAHATETDTIER